MSIENSIFEKECALIIARLETSSPDLCLSSGNSGISVSRDEMIASIKKGDEIGKKYVEIEMKFLRMLKDGTLLKRLDAIAA